MKRIFIPLLFAALLSACHDDTGVDVENTGNPPADVPALDDQGPAVRMGDSNSGKARINDTVFRNRDTTYRPK